jgi:hypothetical protein
MKPRDSEEEETSMKVKLIEHDGRVMLVIKHGAIRAVIKESQMPNLRRAWEMDLGEELARKMEADPEHAKRFVAAMKSLDPERHEAIQLSEEVWQPEIVMPTVYVQAPDDVSDAELRANSNAILHVMERAIIKDGGRVAESYHLIIRRDGDSIKIAVLGSGKILGTVDDASELNIAGWFGMDAVQ